MPTVSMLDYLDAARICAVRKSNHNEFEVTERCDDYYCERLTADQLRQWGEELIAMSQTGKERA